jgi:glycerol uptake facilitator-like aquaporin
MGLMLTRFVSPLRAVMYIMAQCGGGVAGAALVMGVKERRKTCMKYIYKTL